MRHGQLADTAAPTSPAHHRSPARPRNPVRSERCRHRLLVHVVAPTTPGVPYAARISRTARHPELWSPRATLLACSPTHAGRCAIAPRQTYPALQRSRILKPVDDRPIPSPAQVALLPSGMAALRRSPAAPLPALSCATPSPSPPQTYSRTGGAAIGSGGATDWYTRTSYSYNRLRTAVPGTPPTAVGAAIGIPTRESAALHGGPCGSPHPLMKRGTTCRRRDPLASAMVL